MRPEFGPKSGEVSLIPKGSSSASATTSADADASTLKDLEDDKTDILEGSDVENANALALEDQRLTKYV